MSANSARLLVKPAAVLLLTIPPLVATHAVFAENGAVESGSRLESRSARLTPLPGEALSASPGADYLIDPKPFVAKAGQSADGRELVLQNGLVRRAWRLAPGAACVALDNLATGEALLRSVRPEARVTINGVEYPVGGLAGQPNHAYLNPKWLDDMEVPSRAMHLVGFEIGQPQPRLTWNRRRHAAPGVEWPPRGVALRLDFQASGDDGDSQPPPVGVSVHYELYDGVPVFCKWIVVHNQGDEEVLVDRFRAEELAVVEQASWVEARDGVDLPVPDSLHVETDFAFGGMTPANANRHAVHWRTDPLYDTQVNYLKQTPCLLAVEPTRGPAQRVPPGESFESFRIFELVHDRGDRERRGLALRRMYRVVAPWVTENPITHHLLTNDPERVRTAIDEAAEVGFEAIILSFGSGFNMEKRDPQHLAT
ncbi:MAG: hypothetical protein AAF961_13910, partial [Planctomycetota bacterium]